MGLFQLLCVVAVVVVANGVSVPVPKGGKPEKVVELAKVNLESSCKKVSDCKGDNVVCFKDKCLCNPGFFYSKSQKVCSKECEKMTNSYTPYPASFFKKNKLFIKRNLSLQQCKNECSKNKKCLSFSFVPLKDLDFCYFHDISPAKSANFKTDMEERTFLMRNCV